MSAAPSEAGQANPTYGAPARWYHALGLLRDGQTAAARDALRAIADDPLSPFNGKAKTLLPSLPS